MSLVRMITVQDRQLAGVLVDMLRRHGIEPVTEPRAGGQVLDLIVSEVDAARARAVLPLDDLKRRPPDAKTS